MVLLFREPHFGKHWLACNVPEKKRAREREKECWISLQLVMIRRDSWPSNIEGGRRSRPPLFFPLLSCVLYIPIPLIDARAPSVWVSAKEG